MTHEEIYKTFVDDPLLIEKKVIRKEDIGNIKFSEDSNSKLLETLKLAIEGCIKGESEAIISRKINVYLNNK
jgi:hypothetical protein